ncbi:MAG: UvrB/UvrC motif-containing protein [Candidatus Sumerlaeaceae bacterium]|nr:UvrB/UvrC motif-containing protein [Candidatus Sumerlaeaceae bacterium]
MICKKAPATVKVSKLVKGTVREVWMCSRCAEKRSRYHKPITPQQLFKTASEVEALLHSLLNKEGESGARRTDDEDRQCPTCGLPLRTYRDTLFLGCSDCYEAFGDVLTRDLLRYHGATFHCGRHPMSQPETVNPVLKLKDLQRRLELAVRREDFELAARLRDEIKRLKAQIQENPSESAPAKKEPS